MNYTQLISISKHYLIKCLSRFAFVKFSTIADAEAAKNEVNGMIIDERKVLVRFSKSHKSKEELANTPSTTLLVKNVSPDASNVSLQYAFKDCTAVRITDNKQGGRYLQQIFSSVPNEKNL